MDELEWPPKGFTRLTYEIDEVPDGRHAPHGRPTTLERRADARRPHRAARWQAQGAGGGWSWVLSDLKTLLETGAPLPG